MAKPPRQSGRKVSLTPATAKRIAAVVLAYERGNKDMSSPPMRTGSDGTEIIRGTFSGAWAKGSTATVTDAVLSSVTYKAKNYAASLLPSGTMGCQIAYVAGEWVLVAWDWTGLSGYSGTAQQVLAHDTSGQLVWLSTTACT
jgi:hypothetical protein